MVEKEKTMGEYGPFYACQFEACRLDRTYDLEDLREYNGKPICEGCYDYVDPMMNPNASAEQNDEPLCFYELPNWQPKAQPSAEPTDERAMTRLITERDYWEEKATELANDVGKHLGIEVGEHSNLNCPVQNAIDALSTGDGHAKSGNQRIGKARCTDCVDGFCTMNCGPSSKTGEGEA
jgi:hypothetical protein